MKFKLHPLVYIFGLYILVSVYLIISYFKIYQTLNAVEIIDFTPVAYIMLGLSLTLLVLSFFSIFRIPLFHYLFTMLNLWLVIVLGLVMYFYFKYDSSLWSLLGKNAEQHIVSVFPVTNPDVFKPLAQLIHAGLVSFKQGWSTILAAVAIILAVLQVVLYLPASLRFVYHTHISPFFYIFKHILVSVVVLSVVLFAGNFYSRLDSSLNPKLETMLDTQMQPVDDKANAFYPLLSIWMPGVSDRTAEGKRWVSEYDKMITYFTKTGKPIKVTDYPQYNPNFFLGMSRVDIDAINKLYIERLQQKNFKPGPDIKIFSERYHYAIATLRSLYKYKQYQNPVPYKGFSYTYFLKNYKASILALHRLNLLIGMTAKDSNKLTLTGVLFSDYFFNQLVIKNSNDPANKTLYIEKQDITADFINTLMKDPAYQNSALYKLINYVPILKQGDINFSKVARNKMLFFKNLFSSYENLEKSSIFAEQIFDYAFKYNKTLNCIYGNLSNELNLDNLPPVDYLKAQGSKPAKTRLSNIIGDTICGVSVPRYVSNDFIRAIEAQGKIIMLKARARSYEQGIREINMNVFLNNNSGKFYNPFTKRALKWDRENQQIYFEYNNGKKNIRVSL